MDKQTVRDVAVRGRRVLLRTDYNVSLRQDEVAEDLRIAASLPTIRHLQEAGARIVIASHRGRPGGRPDPAESNHPLAPHLAARTGAVVRPVPDCVGPEAEAAVAALEPGEIALLENLRFHPGEEENDQAFARALSRLGDVFVNDAFGAIHRAHASIVGVPRFLPAAAGLLVEREVDCLREVERSPQHPFALVLGGAKVSDKLPLLKHLLPAADVVCLGGAIANAVLAAQGVEIRASRASDQDSQEAAKHLLSAHAHRGDFHLLLPVDVMVAPRAGSTEAARLVPVHEVPDGWAIVDIGPETVDAYEGALRGAQTAIWNGPMGVFEHPPFDLGTRAVARILAQLGSRTVVGGGETVTAVREAGWTDRMWHVSTGGGATLHLLGGRRLPGLEVLPDRAPNSSMATPVPRRGR